MDSAFPFRFDLISLVFLTTCDRRFSCGMNNVVLGGDRMPPPTGRGRGGIRDRDVAKVAILLRTCVTLLVRCRRHSNRSRVRRFFEATL